MGFGQSSTSTSTEIEKNTVIGNEMSQSADHCIQCLFADTRYLVLMFIFSCSLVFTFIFVAIGIEVRKAYVAEIDFHYGNLLYLRSIF